jgi:hypothetical protein
MRKHYVGKELSLYDRQFIPPTPLALRYFSFKTTIHMNMEKKKNSQTFMPVNCDMLCFAPQQKAGRNSIFAGTRPRRSYVSNQMSQFDTPLTDEHIHMRCS